MVTRSSSDEGYVDNATHDSELYEDANDSDSRRKTVLTRLVNVAVNQREQPTRISWWRFTLQEGLGHEIVVPDESVMCSTCASGAGKVVLQTGSEIVGVAANRICE